MFYKDRFGYIYPSPKEVVRRRVNPYDLSTVLPYLKDMDYPFLLDEWQNLLRLYDPELVFDKYIAKMSLIGYKTFGYDESMKRLLTR